MASTSVRNPVTIEADIVSALLINPFSVRSITEQNVIAKGRPAPNLTIKKIRGDHFKRSGIVRRIELWYLFPGKVVLLALSFVFSWYFTGTRNGYSTTTCGV